jgi:hypothetical protein
MIERNSYRCCCISVHSRFVCAPSRPEAARRLLLAAKDDDPAAVRSVLHAPAVQSYYRSGVCRVNPLHVAVLLLHTAAVAALLEHSELFRPTMLGCVDMSDKGDGLGETRRLMPTGGADALATLECRKRFYVRAPLACVLDELASAWR